MCSMVAPAVLRIDTSYLRHFSEAASSWFGSLAENKYQYNRTASGSQAADVPPLDNHDDQQHSGV